MPPEPEVGAPWLAPGERPTTTAQPHPGTADGNRQAISATAGILKAHFDRAVRVLEQQADLRADLAGWRKQAKDDGLVPAAIIKLVREHLRDAEQQRKAAEAAEVEVLYRQDLGLPLFDFYGVRGAAE